MRSILCSLSLLVSTSLASLLFSTSVAQAADTDAAKPFSFNHRATTESDVSAAKGAFEAGQVSFQEADYDRAILYWEDAFRRDCTAVPLLTNLARAYELAGKKKSAVNALESFVERRPESPDRASIDKRIAALKRQLADEKPEPVAVAPAPKKDAPPEKAGPTEVEPTSAEKPKWPIYMTGSGVLVGALGVIFIVDGQSKVDAYKKKCPPTTDTPPRNECQTDAEGTAEEYQKAATDAVGERNLGVVATVIGGGVAVAGAIVWYALWNRDDASATTSFTPIVTPNFGGVQFSGTF